MNADRDRREREQYEAWGVLVRTSNVRAAHIANGIVQLLRIAPPEAARIAAENRAPSAYISAVKVALDARFPGGLWHLTPAARALCVIKSKEGPLRLDRPAKQDTPSATGVASAGRGHVSKHFSTVEGGSLPWEMHRALASALNADGRVMVAGGSDPTTPGFALAGYSSTHTLAGMHAPTFLGALSASEDGQESLAQLYAIVRDDGDPHSSLVRALQIAQTDAVEPEAIAAAAFASAYLMPRGDAWAAWARTVGRLTRNLMRWHERGASKAETLTNCVDLASLLLALRVLRWRPDVVRDGTRPLLVVATTKVGAGLVQAVARAQESLRLACNQVDAEAERAKLITPGKGDYKPSLHALNLAAAGGWVFPPEARGGAKRYVRPGPRQIVTLAHALVAPGEQVSWAEFAARAKSEVGLVFGGTPEHQIERELAIGGVAATLRDLAHATREHLVDLGLARRESDGVVIVDGGSS